ncbi:hydroxymethylglutaryl-CoA reductase [Antrihabitans cavernicola]|uniref:hydroxymethylglutaryl-CoA reductase (NADPH) n=1 Tax=Antrihabitans cavernicola TaxID=2495913 RepID=A0A5A7SGA4_9NOCA|nr:hydroxymethylglutaryl-CoA reductase [Spelaeibacter cavernicola]KAA0024856.1 3-hydroxyacyl-ACP dehydratase [Spelaeibacter cavernicola]
MSQAIDKTPKVPDRGHESEISRQRRLHWIREQSGNDLTALDRFTLDPARLVGNIENLVGSVEIPVGLAGPLLFDGEYATDWITAPFATTEGALVASVSRGALAVSRCGGVVTRVLGQRMIRAPRFDLDDIVSAQRFGQWVQDHFREITAEVATVSRHAKLIELRPVQIGRSVDILFEYETGDASGQNMTTACTWRACLWIEKAIEAVPDLALRSFCIEGNAGGDKKLMQRSLINGRGMRVTAECHIDAATLARVLKVTADDMVRAFTIGVTGTAMSGGVMPNINVANSIAAIFAATGQDLACVHESGAGLLTIEAEGDGIYASLLLPSLAIGTVGGGTSLPQQANYLKMMGCGGTGTARRLAEVIAGYSLALDISTIAAVIGGQFATAHERLGRNRPIHWFTELDLTPEFFQPLLAEATADPGATVETVKILGNVTDASVISELTHRVSSQKLVGILPLDLHVSGRSEPIEAVVKSKPLDAEVVLAAHRLVSLAGGRLSEAWSRGSDVSGFLGTHMRELALYRDPGPMAAVMPKCYGIYEAPEREAFLLVLERLDTGVILKDSGNRPQDWRDFHIEAALTGIAGVHGHWYGREAELLENEWLGPPTRAARVADMSDLWLGLYEHHRQEFPHLVDSAWLAEVGQQIATMGTWWRELEAMPRTLVHNDFNSRNIALRRSPDSDDDGDIDGLSLVAYDWELTTVHVPQRDLVELLAYVLTPDVSSETVEHFVEFHRRAVSKVAGVEITPELWRRGYRLALSDFVIRRLSLYLLAHTVHRLSFIERVVATAQTLGRIENEAT